MRRQGDGRKSISGSFCESRVEDVRSLNRRFFNGR